MLLDKLVLKITLKKHNYYTRVKRPNVLYKYKKPFTLSFTHFTHFTLKIYAEFFYTFYPLLLYVLCFTFFTNSPQSSQ